MQRANQESLLPLLADEEDLPPKVKMALAANAALLRAATARTRIILDALEKSRTLLEDEDFIVLKGCDFALRLYPRPELRPMADIDVLVREGDLERVATLLEKRGLVREFPAGAASRMPSHHEAVFRIDNVTFELHHRFVQKARYCIDYDGVWNRAMRFGRLSDVDAFVYQTISIGIKYFASPLIRFVDLWLMLRSSPGIVERGAALAGEWSATNTYYAVLRYAAALFPEFGADEIQSSVRNVVSPRRRGILDRFVIPQVAPGDKIVPGRARQLWGKFWLMDDMQRRVAFAFSHTAASITGRLRA